MSRSTRVTMISNAYMSNLIKTSNMNTFVHIINNSNTNNLSKRVNSINDIKNVISSNSINTIMIIECRKPCNIVIRIITHAHAANADTLDTSVRSHHMQA